MSVTITVRLTDAEAREIARNGNSIRREGGVRPTLAAQSAWFKLVGAVITARKDGDGS